MRRMILTIPKDVFRQTAWEEDLEVECMPFRLWEEEGIHKTLEFHQLEAEKVQLYHPCRVGVRQIIHALDYLWRGVLIRAEVNEQARVIKTKCRRFAA